MLTGNVLLMLLSLPVMNVCTLIDCQLWENPPEAPNTRSTHWCQQTYGDGDFCLVDKKLSLCRLHSPNPVGCVIWTRFP